MPDFVLGSVDKMLNKTEEMCSIGGHRQYQRRWINKEYQIIIKGMNKTQTGWHDRVTM